jgi:hypothetical protein
MSEAEQPETSIDTSTQRVWEHAGLRCAIRGTLAFVNGYVQVPEGHPARGLSYTRLYKVTDVHGGLTYGGDEDGWVGFDTGHSGDHWSIGDLDRAGVEIAPGMREWHKRLGVDHDPTFWTVELLVAETERLAEQLAALTEIPEPDAYEITDEELAELRAERDALRTEVAAREKAAAEKALRDAAACLDNDDETASWLRDRADVLAGESAKENAE